MSDEKTEEPTEKKLDDAREKGQSAKSQDVNAAAGLLGMLMCLVGTAPAAVDHLRKLFDIFFDHGLRAQTNEQVQALAFDIGREMVLIVLPFLALSVVIGIAISFAQVGIMITFEPLSPDFSKINPADGIKKLVSVRSLIDFAKMLLKAVVLGSVVWVICKGLVPVLVGASLYSPAGIVQVGWEAMLKLLAAAALVFTVIGPVDWGIQKWLFIRDQKMSKDDIKREHKESEGDPQMKGQRKQLAQEIANGAPAKTVPKATVVVANPTHYSVALRYVPGETPLPIIVSKGMDAEALLIREIAQANRIPIVVNPPLARALHRVPVDQVVPEALFEAVATVLRWVRNMNALSGEMSSVLGKPSVAPTPPPNQVH